jgi:cephalosporin-C deacetylase-like acetyl esterase
MTLRDLERPTLQWFYDARAQLPRHVCERTVRACRAGDAARDALCTPEQVLQRQQRVRAFFLESIGGLPESTGPVQAECTGTLHGAGFRVEKLIYQSRPGCYVTANLYVPEGLREPTAAVLFLCGHHERAKHEPEYQVVCQTLTQAGFVVLAQDPIGQGERWSYWEPSAGRCTVAPCCPDHDHAGAQCLPLGWSLARFFLHDAMRGLDLLAGRPEVDAARIAVTGNSGGGTQTSLMMLGDPRIAAAAPATFIMSRETYLYAGGAQDAEQIWPGFTAEGFDHEDILLAAAPKPVCVAAVAQDFFPIEGTRRTVERCRRIWDLMGAPERLALVEEDCGHNYTPGLAREVARFLAVHLLHREPAFDRERIQPFEPSALWCTKSGQVRGEVPGAVSVHEACQERLYALRAGERRPGPEDREWLRQRVRAHRVPCDLNPRTYRTAAWMDLCVEMRVWWAQQDILGHGLLFRRLEDSGRAVPVTIGLWDGGTKALCSHASFLRDCCEQGRAVLVLDVSGEGALRPVPPTDSDDLEFYGGMHKLATDLLWLDDDLAALRTHDVLRALDALAAWPGVDAGDIRIHADGRHGFYGRLAALLDDRIGSVEFGPNREPPGAWLTQRHYHSRDIYSIILRGSVEHGIV